MFLYSKIISLAIGKILVTATHMVEVRNCESSHQQNLVLSPDMGAGISFNDPRESYFHVASAPSARSIDIAPRSLNPDDVHPSVDPDSTRCSLGPRKAFD